MLEKRYGPLDKYLKDHRFSARQLEKFFTNPKNMANVATLVRTFSTNEVATRRGESTLIADALEPSVQRILMQYKFNRKPLTTLGDITQHTRAKISNIPGIGKEELRKIDGALAARNLEYFQPKGE